MDKPPVAESEQTDASTVYKCEERTKEHKEKVKIHL